MPEQVITIAEMVDQLKTLGVEPGGVLVVHTSFRKVKPVENGPAGLIAALEAALTPAGTLVMPTMFYEDDEVFDPKTGSCLENMGVVADTFWRMPGVLRGSNAHAFAAKGKHAAEITAPHPPHIAHGLDTAPGRVYQLDGQILLLGVDHGSNTTIHLAEDLGGARYRRQKYITVLQDGQPTRLDYEEIDHCCERFTLVGDWLDAQNLQRRGKVGHAGALLMRSRDVVAVVGEQFKIDATIFLHPPGVDEECDDARASLK